MRAARALNVYDGICICVRFSESLTGEIVT